MALGVMERPRTINARALEFQHARRYDTSPGSAPALAAPEKQESGKHKVGGQMFIQIIVGQRIPVEGAEDVFKFSAVSFTLPDLLGKGDDLFKAIITRSPLHSNLAGNVASFNSEGSLIGAFVQSPKPVTDEHLQIFSASLQAAEDLAVQNRHMISERHFDDFMLKNSARKAKSGNLVEDAKSIHANPVHGGAVAYKNAEKFGDNHVFRMEWLYKGGRLLTMGPPSTGYQLGVLDERIVAKGSDDHGDTLFITTMLNFIKGSYSSGANSVFGLQINSTATVARCGAANVEDELSKFDMLFNNGNTQYSQTADKPNAETLENGSAASGHHGSTNGTNGASSSLASNDSGGGDNANAHMCGNCGSRLESGHTCMINGKRSRR